MLEKAMLLWKNSKFLVRKVKMYEIYEHDFESNVRENNWKFMVMISFKDKILLLHLFISKELKNITFIQKMGWMF